MTNEENARRVVREYLDSRQSHLSWSGLEFRGLGAAIEAGARFPVERDYILTELTAENQDNLRSLVKDSIHDSIAWEACKQISEQFIRRHEPVPALLESFVLDLLNGNNPRPTVQRTGPDPYKNDGRDSAIVMAVYKATKYLPEYSNGNETGMTACALVAEIMREYGVNIKVSTVVRIWEETIKQRFGKQTHT
ncbi:hypothetical protein [Marinimicrobium sp. ABcell2]|uniref:hypothetical protein n=1 Tax=Marinimicrobium sp. ABcell2 TaxID=3069751 RepID=UPI0027B62BE4|nr:hypothetical protein [Marinimicrobium sp. ABcell2]MDQ2077626.1 hypothetical protein [Marinimicrobium sp. ABcell2]